jgi:hypothetical protein
MKKYFLHTMLVMVFVVATSFGVVYAANNGGRGEKEHQIPVRAEKADNTETKEFQLEVRKRGELMRVESAIERVEQRRADLELRDELMGDIDMIDSSELHQSELVSDPNAIEKLEDLKDAIENADTITEIIEQTEALTELIAPEQQ